MLDVLPFLPELDEGTISDIFVNKAMCLPARGRHLNLEPLDRKGARFRPTPEWKCNKKQASRTLSSFRNLIYPSYMQRPPTCSSYKQR